MGNKITNGIVCSIRHYVWYMSQSSDNRIKNAITCRNPTIFQNVKKSKTIYLQLSVIFHGEMIAVSESKPDIHCAGVMQLYCLLRKVPQNSQLNLIRQKNRRCLEKCECLSTFCRRPSCESPEIQMNESKRSRLRKLKELVPNESVSVCKWRKWREKLSTMQKHAKQAVLFVQLHREKAEYYLNTCKASHVSIRNSFLYVT